MAEALDLLPGYCPNCQHGPVLIDYAGFDADGNDTEKYWAYCDNCQWTGDAANTPDGVAQTWAERRIPK